MLSSVSRVRRPFFPSPIFPSAVTDVPGARHPSWPPRPDLIRRVRIPPPRTTFPSVCPPQGLLLLLLFALQNRLRRLFSSSPPFPAFFPSLERTYFGKSYFSVFFDALGAQDRPNPPPFSGVLDQRLRFIFFSCDLRPGGVGQQTCLWNCL